MLTEEISDNQKGVKGSGDANAITHTTPSYILTFSLTNQGVISTTTYTYDALNRLTSVTSPEAQTTTYTYDIVGNLSTITHHNGNVEAYSYDKSNRLIKLDLIFPS